MHDDTINLGNVLSVGDQIQAFGLARKTGEIRIKNAGGVARINLVDGEVVDSQYGTLTGLDAAFALINLPDARTEFIVGVTPPQRTINLPFMRLLFEAVRRKDELSITTHPLEKDRPLQRAPTLRVLLGDRRNDHVLPAGPSRIGRAISNEIVILDMTVSKHHATLEWTEDGFLLKDLGSTNGTYVAGHRITEHWLSDLCTISFGSVRALFMGPISA